METLVLSHGHTDHLAGLASWASQRQLHNLGASRVYCLPQLAEKLQAWLALTAAMEEAQAYPVEVIPVGAGQEVPLRKDLCLCFFLTSHWTPTLGSLLIWQKKQLKPAFAQLSPEELAQSRRQGLEITEKVEVPLVAYLADTGPEILQAEAWLAQVEVLILECTFLHPKDRERARRFGHMHLQDLQEWLGQARNRHWVLTHLSRRHRLGPASRRLRQALAHPQGPQLHLLNVEWP
jgi:ribonuclease Z